MLAFAVIIVIFGRVAVLPMGPDGYGNCVEGKDVRICYWFNGYKIECDTDEFGVTVASIYSDVYCQKEQASSRYAPEDGQFEKRSFHWKINRPCDLRAAGIVAAQAIETSAHDGISTVAACAVQAPDCNLQPVSTLGGHCTTLWAMMMHGGGKWLHDHENEMAPQVMGFSMIVMGVWVFAEATAFLSGMLQRGGAFVPPPGPVKKIPPPPTEFSYAMENKNSNADKHEPPANREGDNKTLV